MELFKEGLWYWRQKGGSNIVVHLPNTLPYFKKGVDSCYSYSQNGPFMIYDDKLRTELGHLMDIEMMERVNDWGVRLAKIRGRGGIGDD